MALRVIEGFDTYGDPAQITTRAGFLQWSEASRPMLIQGRFSGVGNKALHVDQSGGNGGYDTALLGSFAANMGTVFIGYALFIPSSSIVAIAKHYVALMDTATNTEQMTLIFNATDGSITTPFGRTANNQFAVDTWIFIEIGVVCSKTAGRLQVRINGVAVVDIPGVNTSPSSNQWINGIRYAVVWPYQMNIDDLYLCDDTTGPGAYPCNNFLGDKRVLALKLAGPGSLTGWTPSTVGTPNWQEAKVADADTSYNATNGIGVEDLFVLDQLPSTIVSVIGVQVTGAYKKGDGGAHTLTQRCYSNGADTPGVGFLAPYALQSTYTVYSDLFMVDPATSLSWTLAGVNAMQIGYRLES